MMRAFAACSVFIYGFQATDDLCCQAELSECKACQAGMTEQKWCAIAENRHTDGCDEICCNEGCSEECKMSNAGEIVNTKYCPYAVEDQTAEAWVPTILEADVESTCPWLDYGDQNLEVCEDCAGLHAPCNDTYMACGGCKCTDWHKDMKFNVKTAHTCPEIQAYFKKKNSLTVKCKNASIDAPDPDNTGKIKTHTNNNTAEVMKKLVDGFVKTECRTPINCLKCDKIPFKLEFKCNECAVKGVPKLLKKCCDVCKKWVDGLETDPNIPGHIKAFGWCNGCHDDEIISPMTSRNMPWVHHKLYVNYTEDKADRGMEEHVNDNVCKLLSPTCGPTEAPTEAPTSFPEDERDIKINPLGCLHQTGQCNGGRRLGAADEKSAARNRFLADMGASAAQRPDADITCVEFDASFYTTQDGPTVTVDPPRAELATTVAPVDASSSDGAVAHGLGGLIGAALMFFLMR